MRRDASFAVNVLVVLVQKPSAKPGVQLTECEDWLGWRTTASRCVARQITQQALVDGREESLDFSASARPASDRKAQPNAEIGGYLLEMVRSEVAAMIGVKTSGIPQAVQWGSLLRQTAWRSARPVHWAEGA